MIEKIKIKILNGIGLTISIFIRILGLKKYVVNYLLDNIEKLLLLHRLEGYFVKSGWLNSIEKKSPVDADDNPVPWLTYSFIEFISEKLKPHHTIFEYGCGNSTLYYSQKAARITAAEHDYEWYEKISKAIPSNVILLHAELVYDGDYCRLAKGTGKKYDIIVVDGRDRVNCIKNSLPALKEDGVIILDDSERNEYREGIAFLMKKKFKRLDFWGFSPGLFYNKCTTVFYRKRNCLGI
jgi:hypothetical protein